MATFPKESSQSPRQDGMTYSILAAIVMGLIPPLTGSDVPSFLELKNLPATWAQDITDISRPGVDGVLELDVIAIVILDRARPFDGWGGIIGFPVGLLSIGMMNPAPGASSTRRVSLLCRWPSTTPTPVTCAFCTM